MLASQGANVLVGILYRVSVFDQEFQGFLDCFGSQADPRKIFAILSAMTKFREQVFSKSDLITI